MYSSTLISMLGVSLIFTAGVFFQYPVTTSAFAAPENFTLADAMVKRTGSGLNADMLSEQEIVQDGTKGAMGVAVITDKGFDSVIVSTSHKGVHDSAKQQNANDPVWHNHFVKLAVDSSSGNTNKCGKDPVVKDLMFHSPGNVLVSGNRVQVSDVPSQFSAPSSLSNSTLGFEMGSKIDKVVTFKLNPVLDSNGSVEVVCVTDVTPAGNLSVE
jgi:hypothetical protein